MVSSPTVGRWVAIALLLALSFLALTVFPHESQAMDVGIPKDVMTLSLEEQDLEELARWIDTVVLPIPDGQAPPLSVIRGQGSQGWGSFREPFPRLPAWNPPGPLRVGLQAGHWQYDEAPGELAELRSNPGSYGGNRAEWQVNLELARLAAAYLREAGIEVDILPTTVPVRYRAHAFVTIHCDGDASGVLNSYKTARPGFSSIPEVDDLLVSALNEEYGVATGMPWRDEQVSVRMRWYYAFNARRYQHAVAPGVPQAIIETGFLTSSADRQYLIGDPDRVARGIAKGILRFLHRDSEPGTTGSDVIAESEESAETIY